ncbi:MAG: quaternary ammonium compound efflux SMR transporter SugE [Sulfurimonas sp.]|nr:quaternary ammonium compound efflux SMR transporter SugE [Sulfurimonadaceae bacterium]
MTLSWGILILAGLFEVAWAVGLKYSEGFSKLTPSIITLVAMAISIYLLSLAMRDIPLGSAYAIWVAIGSVGAVIAGVILFDEELNLLKITSMLLVVAGIVGLKLSSST